MLRVTRTLEVAAPVAVLWAFHDRPEALAALQPPWARAEVRVAPRSLETGTRVEVRVWFGPLPMTIVAEHTAYDAGRLFVDRMVRGPFRSWRHEHRFEALAPGAARLIDAVDFDLHGGALGRLVAGSAVARQLERLFDHRHQVTRDWCQALYHIATVADWEAGRAAGSYRAPSLESEGFIHCSSRPQLAPVARAFFAGRTDVVVLRLDPARLDAEVRWEDAPGPTPGPFPHVHGPIPVAAVVDVTPLTGRR
jgi:ligand-binding SRPBCC domain-containing protein/uncharacterized protein (DUF952 family)